ncbi:MAG: monofunctional biosynthetic peptidoglycan transglycosylase [Wenzhouxiangella sp.]
MRQVLRWLLRVVGLIIVLVIGLTLPLRWLDPPTSAFMLADRHVNGRSIQHQWIPSQDIPSHLKLAVIASEDQNFPHHYGFDFAQIRAAVESHRQGGRLRGASTISQQLVRNLYLWPQRSWLRKGLEFGLTPPFELFVPKSRMLDIYLNVVEFDTGVYGAEAASQHYFGKSARSITRQEAALLAAVLPAPKRLDAGAPDASLLQRQRWILGQMDNLGSGWLPE